VRVCTLCTNPDYPDEKHDYHDFKQGRRFLDYNPFGIIYAKNVDLSDKESNVKTVSGLQVSGGKRP
jgi:hypothetical protein